MTKKLLTYLMSLLLTACSFIDNNYNQDSYEIALFSVNKQPTKVPVDGAAFPDDYAMKVAAYLSWGEGAIAGNYFDGTTFSKNGSVFTGHRYWPVSAATINFLAVAPENNEVTTLFNADNHVSAATTQVSDNATKQYDVMYAVKRATKISGKVPDNVGMVFKHAYCWVDFNFKTTNSLSTTTIEINELRLNDVACDGTLAINVANASHGSAELTTSQSWSDFTTSVLSVPVLNPSKAFVLKDEFQEYNKGLLLIPQAPMTSFDIVYTIYVQGNKHQFTYRYTPASPLTWDAATKYSYNITVSLETINIELDVDEWKNYDEKDMDVRP